MEDISLKEKENITRGGEILNKFVKMPPDCGKLQQSKRKPLASDGKSDKSEGK